MTNIRIAILIGVVSFRPSLAAAQTAPPQQPDLAVTVLLSKNAAGTPEIQHDEPFAVIFTNNSSKPIRLTEQGCHPGHTALTFRVREKEGNAWIMQKAVKELPDWSEFRLKMLNIPPGGMVSWQVRLSDFLLGDWTWQGVPEANTGEYISLTAVFEIKTDELVKRHSIWTGRVQSAPVTAKVVNLKLKTAEDYLRNRCPKQALKMLKADPKEIHKHDREYRCTPLHHATTYGYAEVVEWLLANGADVNAAAYNQFTPLHMASDPQIVRLLLKSKPDLTARSSSSIQTPLEHAASCVAQGGPDAQKWRQIAQLLLDAGTPYHLQAAIYLNDLERVRAILKENPRLANDPAGAQRMPLSLAARQGRVEICKVLLQYKADPDNFEHGNGFSILHDGIAHPAVVRLLLDAGADLKRRITWRGFRSGIWVVGDEATALHFAAQAGAVESAKLLLDRGINVNAVDSDDQTALHVAAYFGHADMLRFLLKRAVPDAKSNRGFTALHFAVSGGQPQMVKDLLEHQTVAQTLAVEGPGLMLDAAKQIWPSESKEGQGRNAAHAAVIDVLQSRGIAIDIFTAVVLDKVSRAKELLKADPTVAKSKCPDGEPILHRAVTLDRHEIANLLLKAGANANDPDDSGYTALHRVAFWGREEIAKLLIRRGADVNARTKDGFTPLHESARLGTPAIGRLLLAAGAKVNATDNEGRTALSWAGRFGRGSEMVDLLIEHGGQK